MNLKLLPTGSCFTSWQLRHAPGSFPADSLNISEAVRDKETSPYIEIISSRQNVWL
jgi:hypothetical protein